MAALLLTCVAFAGAVASAPTKVAAPSSAAIGNVSFSGSGCPSGTTSVLLATDKQSFQIIFDEYLASVGGKTVNDKKQCNIDIDLVVPTGYQYSLSAVNYRGGIFLDSKVTAELIATYKYTGSQGQAKKSTTWKGPMDYESYVFTDAFDSPAWSKCNPNKAPIQISSSISLSNTANKGGSGLITSDSADGAFVQKYTIEWAKC
ncbi:hypothetical protein HK097_002715 [Rhizophlyctis rosea]|uniref:DUF4360 domain-containing protein n=1 Tax=Rhizophlyctis rosea TaxID=64517 RepID=A0AAD5X727_9FUNG|nr:hypothetical protein HK097_002715 [Rhizophlyctis rosea]